MQKRSALSSAFLGRHILSPLLVSLATCSIIYGPLLTFTCSETSAKTADRALTFEERVAYQQAIEEVYWRHRIWPKERSDPNLRWSVMSQAQLEKKVTDYLRNSQALQDYWQRPITPEQLQAEMDRMAMHTKQPEVLHELFEALGNDPFVIAECLAKPVLAERTLATFDLRKERFESRMAKAEMPVTTAAARAHYTLPAITTPSGGCVDDTWTTTSITNAPESRSGHTGVWTGSEMIIWGGGNGLMFNTGGRYNPSTDSWAATTINNAPSTRVGHTAVWSGSEMIVWGGVDDTIHFLNTGGRYNPGTDSWVATSITNAPDARDSHTAVWTGSEMIVWGGHDDGMPSVLNTGGRYNPISDSWTATSMTNAADARRLTRCGVDRQ